nr:MAG TPA: hypothetical protein [Caudoviricetes sp.]
MISGAGQSKQGRSGATTPLPSARCFSYYFNPHPFPGDIYSLSRRTPKVNRRNFL